MDICLVVCSVWSVQYCLVRCMWPDWINCRSKMNLKVHVKQGGALEWCGVWTVPDRFYQDLIIGVLSSQLDFPHHWKKKIESLLFHPSDSVNVELDGKTLRLNQTLKHRHLADSYTTGDWNYTLAAEVGLLTRNIVIEGADDTTQALDKQSFGCRVLFGSFEGSSALSRRIRVENVEFRHCGQEGWSDPHDPRWESN